MRLKAFLILIALIFCVNLVFTQDSLKPVRSIYWTNFLIPSVGIGLGFYSRIDNVPFNKYEVRNSVRSNFGNFHSDVDDYIQFAPIAGVYALNFTNLRSVHNFKDQTLGLIFSQVIVLGIVHPMKYGIGDQRPNNGAFNSFPSGHTSEAFMAAQFFWKEYGKKYPVLGAIAYGCAVTTGVFRILNDRHWSSDVLAGAGIGILSVNLGYICLNWYKKRYDQRSKSK